MRDRIGEKPLYVGSFDNRLIFASELKALVKFSGLHPQLSSSAISNYFLNGYIEAQLSIYENVLKLFPDSIYTITCNDRVELNAADFRRYWSMQEEAQNGHERQFVGSVQDASLQLELLIKDVVSMQLRADVPVGLFLSGGIDSSTVVALAKKVSSIPIKTFSISFEAEEFNEAPFARAIARYLKLEHTELKCKPDDALDLVEILPTIYDEPFADSSQIPTLLLSKLTRDHVTVCLSGDGGDELFHGYDRYFSSARKLQLLKRIPDLMIKHTKQMEWVLKNGFLGKRSTALLHTFKRMRLALADKGNYGSCYEAFNSRRPAADTSLRPALLLKAEGLDTLPDLSFHQVIRLVDSTHYLPDDILVKVDRASMAFGLETRCPLLNHRIVRFACSLPDSLLFNRHQGKLPLRSILDMHIPQQLVNRPKMGFGVPIADWLRGPLRKKAEEFLFGSDHLLDEIFCRVSLRRIWAGHMGGHHDWSPHLWAILMFIAWKYKFLNNRQLD